VFHSRRISVSLWPGPAQRSFRSSSQSRAPLYSFLGAAHRKARQAKQHRNPKDRDARSGNATLVSLSTHSAPQSNSRPDYSPTAGGDVSSYSEKSDGGMRSPLRRLTSPLSPKPAIGFPLVASSAMSRASMVAMKTRRGPIAGFHKLTPRLAKSPYPLSRGTF